MATMSGWGRGSRRRSSWRSLDAGPAEPQPHDGPAPAVAHADPVRERPHQEQAAPVLACVVRRHRGGGDGLPARAVVADDDRRLPRRDGEPGDDGPVGPEPWVSALAAASSAQTSTRNASVLSQPQPSRALARRPRRAASVGSVAGIRPLHRSVPGGARVAISRRPGQPDGDRRDVMDAPHRATGARGRIEAVEERRDPLAVDRAGGGDEHVPPGKTRCVLGGSH